MKDFLKYNFKYILLTFFGFLLVYLLVRSYSKDTNNPELVKYKLDQIDEKIKNLNKNIEKYNDSITEYKKEIVKLDYALNNIKIQKKIINNYYDENVEKIKILSAKEVDSALRKRYKY